MRQLKLVLILLSISITTASAQSLDTQTRGYWIDPATKIMWAAKDNGKDVSWHNANDCGC